VLSNPSVLTMITVRLMMYQRDERNSSALPVPCKERSAIPATQGSERYFGPSQSLDPVARMYFVILTSAYLPCRRPYFPFQKEQDCGSQKTTKRKEPRAILPNGLTKVWR
jgi:hypothetical protein